MQLSHAVPHTVGSAPGILSPGGINALPSPRFERRSEAPGPLSRSGTSFGVIPPLRQRSHNDPASAAPWPGLCVRDADSIPERTDHRLHPTQTDVGTCRADDAFAHRAHRGQRVGTLSEVRLLLEEG